MKSSRDVYTYRCLLLVSIMKYLESAKLAGTLLFLGVSGS